MKRQSKLASLARALALVPFTFAAVAPLGLGAARAESWCASPLYVHEWGVHVFAADGAPAASIVADPGWFHSGTGGPASAGGPSVRDLPADSGIRALPVVTFYSPGALGGQTIPVGLEVGFAGGPAALWFPQVDLLRTWAEASSPRAMAARAQLVAARVARAATGGTFRSTIEDADRLAKDPVRALDTTKQLVWNRLDLTPEATHKIVAGTGDARWIDSVRKGPGLWVNGATESDRFLFYEAQTNERVPLALSRAAGWAPGHRALTLTNTSKDPVHDLVIVQRDGVATFVVNVDALAPGKATTFVLEDHRVDAAGERAVTREKLRAALLDGAQSTPPTEARWDMNHCVMGRDPAIPVESASGHRLYAHEVDTILGAWGARFFDQQGTSIVYREDDAALERAMPLAVYTDMFSYPVLSRASLGLWQPAGLP